MESTISQDILNQFELLKPKIRKTAYRILNDDGLADDMVHEVYLKLCASNIDKIKSYLEPWLITVAKNNSLKLLAKHHRYVSIDDREMDNKMGEYHSPFEEIAHKEDVKRLKKYLKRLSPRLRKLIKLQHYQNLSYKEIAKKANITVTNVGFLIHKAIHILKHEFEKDDKKERVKGILRSK